MWKKAIAILLGLLAFAVTAQGRDGDDDKKYLAGAVPMKNGIVIFDKTYKVSDKSKLEIYKDLRVYADSLLNGENSLEQSAIVEADSLQGLLALRMEENLYFRRSAWVTHYTRFYYELIFTIADGSFNVEMRRIHYLYEEEAVERTSSFTAEEWITDEEALSKDGKKLTRISGRFRRATIDRKDEIFRGAGLATGAIRKRKVVQVIETEE